MLPAAATTAYAFNHHVHHHHHGHYRNHSNHPHHIHARHTVLSSATAVGSGTNSSVNHGCVVGKTGNNIPRKNTTTCAQQAATLNGIANSTTCSVHNSSRQQLQSHRRALQPGAIDCGGSVVVEGCAGSTVVRHHTPWTIAFFAAASALSPLDGPQKEVVQVNWRRTGRRYTQKYRQQQPRPRSPIKSEGGFLVPQREPTAFAPSLQTRIGYVDDEDPISESYDLPGYTELLVTNGHEESVGLVAIRMKPDEQGRFGFNVKGGADQNMPIIVSRVAPHTPADHSVPRLNEGDQVLCINGRDVSGLSHEQVVQLIRASRDLSTKELVLTVKPNVYVAEETEEPPFQYVPDVPHISQKRVPEVDALSESILLLSEGLDSGAVIAQFEQLYRKKPNMTLNIAKLPENMFKNRYRDISPYDSTRVTLHGGATGDYINASHVNMEIPTSGIINRYIAAQGPLPTTCSDFWQMVWEQQSTLIVMLTTVLERGRVKCHQYWPDLYSSMDCGTLHITCHKEQEGPSFAFREFTLINSEVSTSEERHITHMQYIAWPDHGVPDESSDFLEFVQRVRQNRIGMVEATLVHCSAGIGRTGVLILMETAMCLIEANEPVYPLDIVRNMRDQRAMLIQNASQYKFVCEAILKVYNEKIVKPLPEYHR